MAQPRAGLGNSLHSFGPLSPIPQKRGDRKGSERQECLVPQIFSRVSVTCHVLPAGMGDRAKQREPLPLGGVYSVLRDRKTEVITLQ